MALQQIVGVTHMGSTGGGGGGPDSAYLPENFSVSSVLSGVSLIFYDTALLRSSSEVSGYGDSTQNITWKTGPNDASAYEVNFIKTVGGTGLGGSSVNTWIQLGTAQLPTYTMTFGIGSTASGWLVIRNISNPSVELANVQFGMYADPNA